MSIHVRNWCVSSGYASVPGTYAQGYALVPGAYAQHLLKGPLHSVHKLVPGVYPDSYLQRRHQFLMHMLRIRISSWRPCLVHASVPTAHAEGIQNEHLKNGNWCSCMLKIKLRICGPKLTPKYLFKNLISTPKSPLYGMKIMKIRATENLTL